MQQAPFSTVTKLFSRISGAFLILAALSACQTLDTYLPEGLKPSANGSQTDQSGTGQSGTGQSGTGQSSPEKALEEPVSKIDPLTPGQIYFRISTEADTIFFNWHAEILEAKKTPGFRSFRSTDMWDGGSLRVQLWPDTYRVRVILEDNVEMDDWVEIKPGETVFAYLNIGFFSTDVDLYEGEEAKKKIAEYGIPQRDLPVHLMFDPLRVQLIPNWEGRYYGPREGGTPLGNGRLDIYEGSEKVASIENATTENGHFYGTPGFMDGRSVDGVLDGNYTYPEGTVSIWPDGTRYEGRYYGLNPDEGTITYTDGRKWKGKVKGTGPEGNGDVTLSDGTVIEGVPGFDPTAYDGAYQCTRPDGTKGTCFYFEGKEVASSKDYIDRVNERERVNNPPAPPVAEPSQQQSSAQGGGVVTGAQPAPDTNTSSTKGPDKTASDKPDVGNGQPLNGCTYVQGKFVADGGRSKLSFDGKGKGHMWQQTYGGYETYTFDIDFTYSGTRNGMRFDYGPAIYKDASGKILQTQQVPGGDSECAYDGKTLNINGKDFKRTGS